MKHSIKHLITALLCVTVLQSCVVTDTVREIDDRIEEYEKTANSRSTDYKEGSLILEITNRANNISLVTDSIEICNILIKNEATGGLKTGNRMLLKNMQGVQTGFEGTAYTDTIKLPAQKFSPWVPDTLPANSTGMYIKIYGKILTYIAYGEPYILSEGPMFFTFTGNISDNYTLPVKFELNDNCLLFCITNDKVKRVLVPITIDVSVDEWEYP